MRVYVPNKQEDVVVEVLKDLYLLRQSIEHDLSSPEARAAAVDKIRDKLKELLAKPE